MMDKYFSRGVEVVTGCFIINDINEILLVKQPKWKDVWLVCGGHVDVGEKIETSAIRETKEELGIDVDFISTISFSESICYPPEFYRNAHLIFFNCLLKYKKSKFVLNEEISEAKWFSIEEALSLPDLKKSCFDVIKQIKDII